MSGQGLCGDPIPKPGSNDIFRQIGRGVYGHRNLGDRSLSSSNALPFDYLSGSNPHSMEARSASQIPFHNLPSFLLSVYTSCFPDPWRRAVEIVGHQAENVVLDVEARHPAEGKAIDRNFVKT